MAKGYKSNLLGVEYSSANEGKISSLSFYSVLTPDSSEWSGIYPGL